MSITLFCLVKGNTTANAFPVHIDKGQFVGDLKEAIKDKIDVPAGFKAKDLKLWKVEISGDHVDPISNLSLQDKDELLATRDIGDYWTEKPPKRHIHVVVKLPLLSLEEALSCIPPPITYSSKCTKSKNSTKVNGDPPTRVLLWGDFFEEVNRFRFDQQPIFERPRFNDEFNDVVDEEDVRNAIKVNFCQILNKLTGPDCVYSRLPTHTPGIPDFNCHLVGSLILVIEVKRKHVLEDIKERTFPEFYQADEKARMVIQQIYNYMGVNELRYGILATYDNHWFLRREHTELWISKTLPLQSESPPVLKAYAYLARQAEKKPHSLNPLQVPHGDNNSRVLRSQSKKKQQTTSSQKSVITPPAFGTSSNIPVYQQNYNFTDFKFKGILGEGRSGKTLLCELRGETIALKSVDLSKAPSYVLEEMQKEVEIYKDLSDIQGKYIPKLVCYGYYGGGMSFVIGMSMVGTTLNDHKITKWQRSKAIKGLEAIHKHGILHNDIREENILINDNDDIYLIDFGMASRADTKKKRKLFEEEQLKLSQLLDRYILYKSGRISKSRKCNVVS